MIAYDRTNESSSARIMCAFHFANSRIHEKRVLAYILFRFLHFFSVRAEKKTEKKNDEENGILWCGAQHVYNAKQHCGKWIDDTR